MAELITVPTFTFNQGDIFSGEGNAERPIHVDFYSNGIALRQDGEYEHQDNIHIGYEFLEPFFKEIKKHLPEAKKMLDR